jgi:hypothetical protein
MTSTMTTTIVLSLEQEVALSAILSFAAQGLALEAAANERHLERLVERFQGGDPYMAIPEAAARQRELEQLLEHLTAFRRVVRSSPAPSAPPTDQTPAWMAGLPVELD